jgi:hypothetical protein
MATAELNTGAPAGALPQETQSAGSSTNAAASQDYQARLESDHKFAVEMAKKNQARADQAENENRGYREFKDHFVGPELEKAIKEMGGGVVAYRHLVGLSAAMTNEVFRKAYENYQITGKFELNPRSAGAAEVNGSEETQDEYLTIEERKIRALEEQNRLLQQRVGNVEISTGRAALQGHMDKLLANYALEPEQVKQVRHTLDSAFNQMQKSGTATQFEGTNGYQFARSIALSALDDSVIQQSAERARLRKQGQLGRLATDGPSGSSGRGEPPPVFKNPADAIAWFRANSEHEP